MCAQVREPARQVSWGETLLEANDTLPAAPEAPAAVPAHRPRPRPRGRTTPIIAAAALLGIVGGVAVGYGVQAEREPTPPAALSQPGLGYPAKPLSADRAPAPLPAAQDRRVKTDGDLRKLLVKDAAPRHIAARGWTMPDGTTSRIYLVRFNSTAFASRMIDDLDVGSSAGTPLARTDTTDLDPAWGSVNDIESLSSLVFAEQAPFGAEHVRQAYTLAGDKIALVVHERPGKRETARIPFQQTLILQNQLLA
ncbi:hypothetical protein LMJ41_16200 [Streptomyces globisporus]|nr:hypothetical protein [Streptomyces globisporus]